MLKICKQLFDAWNKEIAYIHWKSNEHLEAGLNGLTDLDILIKRTDRDSGLNILKAVGFIPFRSQFGSRYPYVEDWIGLDDATGKLVHIHLHFRLITGHRGLKEYELPWTELALSSRIQDMETGVYIMNPNLEILTLFTRIGLKATYIQQIKACVNKKGICNCIKENLVNEIEYLSARVDWSEVANCAGQYYEESTALIIHIIRSSSKLTNAQFLALCKNSRKAMRNQCRYPIYLLFFLRSYYFITSHLLFLLKRKFGFNLITRKVLDSQKGFTVAFVGQDGAGKSTLSENIEKWLTWKIDVTRYYMGSGENYHPWQKKIRKTITGSKNILCNLLKHILGMSILISYSKRVKRITKWSQKYAEKGGIVIYDRFPQVQYNGINDGPKIRDYAIKKLNNLILRKLINYFANIEEANLRIASNLTPDVVFKLMLPIEESMKRKPYEDLMAVEKKNQIVADLFFKGSDVYEIDARQDQNLELLQVKRLIWKYLSSLQ